MATRDWPSATTFLQTLVGDERVTTLDGECVDSVHDYRAAIDALLAGTSAGEVTLTHFEGVEGASRRLTIALNGGAKHGFELRGGTDWLDQAALVGGLQTALQRLGYARRLVAYWCRGFGQEVGFAMLSDEQLRALYEFGLEQNAAMIVYLGADDVLDATTEDMDGDPTLWEELLTAPTACTRTARTSSRGG